MTMAEKYTTKDRVKVGEYEMVCPEIKGKLLNSSIGRF